MPAGEVSVVLAVLRVVRGWNQDDLARASGVRNSAISDYERGRKVPELKTLERLIMAMGYPLSAVDHARVFIAALRSGAWLFDAGAAGRSLVGPALAGPGPAAGTEAAYEIEIEQATAEVSLAVSRMARVVFALIAGARDARPADGPRE